MKLIAMAAKDRNIFPKRHGFRPEAVTYDVNLILLIFVRLQQLFLVIYF